MPGAICSHFALTYAPKDPLLIALTYASEGKISQLGTQIAGLMP